MTREAGWAITATAVLLTAGCSCGDEKTGSPRREPVGEPASIEVAASVDRAEGVTIGWEVPEGATPTGFVVLRDTEAIAELPAAAREHVDETAAPGWAAAPTAVSATSRENGISLAWEAAVVHPGQAHGYQVVAVYEAGESAPSAVASGRRGAPALLGYRVLRDDVEVAQLEEDLPGRGRPQVFRQTHEFPLS